MIIDISHLDEVPLKKLGGVGCDEICIGIDVVVVHNVVFSLDVVAKLIEVVKRVVFRAVVAGMFVVNRVVKAPVVIIVVAVEIIVVRVVVIALLIFVTIAILLVVVDVNGLTTIRLHKSVVQQCTDSESVLDELQFDMQPRITVVPNPVAVEIILLILSGFKITSTKNSISKFNLATFHIFELKVILR